MIETPKTVTWKDRLKDMEPESTMKVALSSFASVRSKISDLKAMHPDRDWDWTTKLVRRDGKAVYGLVKRTK